MSGEKIEYLPNVADTVHVASSLGNSRCSQFNYDHVSDAGINSRTLAAVAEVEITGPIL